MGSAHLELWNDQKVLFVLKSLEAYTRLFVL